MLLRMQPEVLVVTSNDVPGHRTTVVFGEVFGVVVYARDYFSNVGARFRTLVGGEVRGYTDLVLSARNTALDRLRGEAQKLGANAVIATRFDTSEIGGIMSEILAYGTAVQIEMDDEAPQVRLQLPAARRAAESVFAKPGATVCSTPDCEAEGLPTPLSVCDVCGRPTTLVPG
jgi:uncharacterized protein YbjQ (UPF0145 family)